MEFTGERYIPEVAKDSEIEAEHQQRYHAVKELVRGKVVVDAASGAGYGTHILASTAAIACGVDISQEAVLFSSQHHHSPNLHYLQGSIAKLPFPDRSVDVVVSFETIEHVAEDLQQTFLTEIQRVLKEDGLLIISTPDKQIYSDLPGYANEFHIKEFYRQEFKDFLSSYFKNIILYDQYAALSYILSRPDCPSLNVIRPKNDRTNQGKYMVALCSDQDLPSDRFTDTIMVDTEGRYQNKVDRVVELQGEIVEKNTVITGLEGWVQKCRKTIEERDQTIKERDAGQTELRQEIDHLRQEVSKTSKGLQNEQAKSATLESQLRQVQGTKGWKLLQKLYWLQSKLTR